MLVVTTSKQEIINKEVTKVWIFTIIFFFGGILLIPIGIGLIMLPIGILGFIAICLHYFLLPKRIKSYSCPACSTEIFWLINKADGRLEKGLNCPTCQKRLLIKESQLALIS